jgi:cytochrome d ubiquinol oxidase subunit II
MGTVAGGIASGRVPPGLARGDPITSWCNPTALLGGVLAVGTCSYLAAIYLCHDALRLARPDLAGGFQRRGLITGAVLGAVALGGIAVLESDAPALAHGLTHRALPLVIVSALAGVGSLALLATRRYLLVRAVAALAVTAVLWGWALAQYPHMLPPDVDYSQAAASHPVLTATLTVSAIGAALLLPSLGWLFSLFQRRTEAVGDGLSGYQPATRPDEKQTGGDVP